jgi:gliding motility-associated-like protein
MVGNAEICEGQNTPLQVNFVNGTAPFSITYTENGVEKSISNIVANPFVLNVSPIVTTTYVLTKITDNTGCEQLIPASSGTVVVTVRPLPGIPGVITGKNIVCQGETGVSYSIAPVTGAVSYIWQMPAGFTLVAGAGTSSITVNVATDATQGIIRVYPVNGCANGAITEILVNVDNLPAKPGPITSDQGTSICQGTTGVVLRIPEVSNSTSYQWQVPGGIVIVAGQGTATLQVNLDPNQSSITGDVTVTAYNGCGASIVSDPFNLTIHPSPVAFAGFDENICSSDFTFKAQNPGAGFTGTWRIIMGSGIVTSLNNPTSMVTNLAKGENKFVWTVRNNVTGCEFRDTLSVFNNTLVVTAVSASHDVCDGSTVLYGTPLPEGVTGLWTFVTGSGSFQSATSASTIVSNLSPDQNIIRWTQVKNGCVSFADVEVYNHQPSEAVILNNDFSVCGTSATISSVAPLQGTGRWTLVSGGGTIDNPLSTTINISNLAIGNNTFRWSVEKNGCIRTDDITIRNNQLIVSAGIDQTICSATTQLAGSLPPAGVTACWYIPVGQGSGSFANAFVYNTNISNLSQGTNMLVWEQNQDGCISADTVLITSNRPTSAMVGSVQTVCADTARLSGNQPLVGQGLWSVVSGFGRFDNASDPVTVVRGIMDGQNIFRWTIMENGCRSYADLIINSNKVVVYAGRDTSVCERVAYLNATPPTKGIGEWNVVPGMGSGSFFPHRFDPKARVGGLNPGTNAFIWTVTYNGCVSSDTVVVTNNTPTEANAGADQIISGNTTRLNATPAVIGTGRWTIIAGSGTFEDVTNPYSLVTNLQRGDNVLRWTVTHIGCTSFDDVIITNGQTIEANAGLDQETCNSEADLHANDPDVGIGEWSVVSGSGKIVSPGNPRSKVVDLGPGANVFRWTIYYTNSSSSDLVTITNNTPTTAYAGPDRTICRDTHVLEGVVPVVGNARWSIISGGGVIADPSLPNSAISNLSQGANVLKYEITNQGCTSIDSVRITNGLPTPAYAGTDEIICTDSLQLQPNNPSYGVGEWRVAEGTAVFDGVWAKKLSPGINRLVWVISTASCSSSDTIVVENNKPSDAFAGFDRTVCDPLVQLASNTPMIGNGTWSLISGTGSIADVTDPRTIVTNLGKGSNRFRWTIDNQGCVSFDDVEISNNLIEAFAGYDQTNCADTAVLVANNPAPGTGTWGLVGGSGSGQFDDPSNPFTTVRNLDRGQNTLTWTIRHGGCVSVSTVVITNNNPTFANAGPNVNTCDNFVTLSANNPSVGIGTWTIRNGSGTFDNMGSPTARVTDLSFGRNLFRWTVENQGCVSFDDVEVSYNTIQAVVGPTQNICSNTTILEANNPFPGTGSWSVVGGASQAVFEQISNPNTRVSNLARGRNILRWSINNVGCSTFADVEIINNSPSTAYAGNNIEICSDVTTLDATPATVGVGRWEVLTGSGVIADVNNPKSSVTGLSKGDNIFRWTVQNLTCSDADEVLVTNNQPSVPYAGADLETCSPNLSLKANIPEYGTGLWTIQQGSGNIQSATSPETFISNLAPGVNVLRWTLTKGQCAVFDEITIANNTATVANAGPDIQDCKDFAYLDANIPTHGTGLWSVVSGRGSFDNSTDAKTRVFDLGFGENILLWTVQNGNCFSTDQITIFNKVPDQAAAGSDRIICEDYVGLNANNPLSGSGQWSVLSGSGTFVDATRYDTRVNNVGFGENIYKWTISYGECTTEDLVMVTSNKSRPYAGEDDVTYTPSYNLMASNPGALQGRWSVVGGSGSFADATFFNTAVNGLSEGVNTFRWTIEVNGCIAYDDVSITYKVVPDAGFIVDTDRGCYPLTVQFTNYSVGGTSYYWDFGDGNTSLMRNPKHVYTQPGQFTAVLTVPGPDGKDAIFTQLIRVYDHPVASFEISPRTVYVPGDQIRCINTSIDARTYLWDFGDGNTSTAATPTYGYQETGFYTISLTVWNQYGCEDKMTIVDAVEALSAGFITFPNAFKPRPGVDGVPADDRNLVFKPIFSQVDQYHMQIFNRWGQLIFESFDVNVGWDGTYNGKLSPQDVYIYKVSGRFMSGKEFRTAGNVMLVR